MNQKLIQDRYLGDGVYASWDGYYLWLDTRAQLPVNRIGLEPEVQLGLDQYKLDIQAAIEAAQETRIKALEDLPPSPPSQPGPPPSQPQYPASHQGGPSKGDQQN